MKAIENLRTKLFDNYMHNQDSTTDGKEYVSFTQEKCVVVEATLSI